MERLVKFEVFGHEYPVYTDVPEEDVEEILRLVKKQIEGYSQNAPGIVPNSKIAVLASLNMAGKYVSLKREFEQYKQSMEQYAGRLNQMIERSFAQGEQSKREDGGV